MTSITLVRQVAARPAVLFEALTTSEGVAAWWSPFDLPVTATEVDARIGGIFRVRFPSPDGEENEAVGEYLELAPPSRLAMSWRWVDGGVAGDLGHTSRIEIELRPVEGGSELTVTHSDLRDEASGATHEQGWSAALAKLARLMDTTAYHA